MCLRTSILSLLILGLHGCTAEPQPIIKSVTPLNGRTQVTRITVPQIVFGGGAIIDATDRKIVLYDVTRGSKTTVAGSVAIAGNKISYQTQSILEANRNYRLVLEAQSVTGESLAQVDGSEDPKLPIRWPFHLNFSTDQAPQVRAAYLLRRGKSPRIRIDFSQPMSPAVAEPEIQIIDLIGKALSVASVVWLNDLSVRIDLTQELDPAGVYTLRVGKDAQANDGTPLDGNSNFSPGESDDDFEITFTGSQEVILSRLR